VRPGEGRVEHLGDGVGVAFELWGADTGGSIPVVEHTREDEYSIVTEGEIGFRSGRTVRAHRTGLLTVGTPADSQPAPRKLSHPSATLGSPPEHRGEP
jgi:hypothetical protein